MRHILLIALPHFSANRLEMPKKNATGTDLALVGRAVDWFPMSEAGDRKKLVAILAADAAGYSQLVSLDAAGAVAALEAACETFRQETAACEGRVIDTAGDSVLAVFSTCAGAFNAALAIQRRLADAGPAGAPIRPKLWSHCPGTRRLPAPLGRPRRPRASLPRASEPGARPG